MLLFSKTIEISKTVCFQNSLFPGFFYTQTAVKPYHGKESSIFIVRLKRNERWNALIGSVDKTAVTKYKRKILN